MRRREVIDEHWEEFLRYCHVIVIEPEYEGEKLLAEPTEVNFWRWYMVKKMMPDMEEIQRRLKARQEKDQQ